MYAGSLYRCQSIETLMNMMYVSNNISNCLPLCTSVKLWADESTEEGRLFYNGTFLKGKSSSLGQFES